MRHCMIVHSIYPYDETRVQRQAEALVEHGFDVDVIGLLRDSEPRVETVNGVAIYRLPVRRDKRRGVLGQLLEYITFMLFAFVTVTRNHIRRRYDTVQIHNLPDFLVFSALVPRLTGSRIILDLHDLMPEFYCAKFGTEMSSPLVRLITLQEQIACRFAHHVITVTEMWRQTLIRRGVPSGKCSVVMNLADTRYYDQLAASDVDPSAPLKLLYHGTLTRRYGLDTLLQAISQARASIPGARLTIHGRGEYIGTIRDLVRSLELESIVSVETEFLSPKELGKLIKAHHVGIVPYRSDIFTDGILPTKLMEYFALGRAVVAARTPAISAYCDDSMVEFFTPGDVDDLTKHIVNLYRNPQRRNELARNTSRFNQKYNWASQRERYVDLIASLGRPENIHLVDVAGK